jgi:cell shape-determining protein MreD
VLKQLAVERQSFHRRRMWQSAVIAPLMLPFALIPMYVPPYRHLLATTSY